ncbi:hypothetical protein MRX96_003184 [Rhipicephalus microplus]|uniref:Putative secreted protein fat body overexpressed n=1 Tax=Rhipicephalus microplus TaxID=6941 RepID=A0A6M2D9S4_RHIMP
MQQGSMFFVSVLTVCLLATDVTSRRPDRCATVRCAGCPSGSTFSPTPRECCRCVPKVDCRVVFCRACPSGTTLRQTPLNCCECVRRQI